MKLLFLSTLALLVVSVSARVGDGSRNLELSQIKHQKLRRATENQAIEGKFIVVLSDLVDNVLQYAYQLLSGTDAKLEYEYDSVFKGFVVNEIAAEFLLAILDDSMVEYVEEVRSYS